MTDGPVPHGALDDLLSDASIEVTAREPGVALKLRDSFAPGTKVHVTFLPDDDRRSAEATAAELRKAGFDPTPHLTARNFPDSAALADHLAHLSADAGVTRALAIAGDVDRPRGEFSCSMDVLRTGLLQKNGIRTIVVAGHPEGHPAASSAVLESALVEKVSYAREHGLKAEIATQFCFEAGPIVSWLERVRALGIDAPVRVGVAGPASTATLLKYAVRCGIGNSLRVVRRRAASLGKMLGDTTPDELLQELSDQLDGRGLGPIAGIHLYMFGGAKKTGAWLADARRASAVANADPALLRSAAT